MKEKRSNRKNRRNRQTEEDGRKVSIAKKKDF